MASFHDRNDAIYFQGIIMNFQEYPKMLYKLGDSKESQIVNSQVEEDDMGDNWIDAIIDPVDIEQAPST